MRSQLLALAFAILLAAAASAQPPRHVNPAELTSPPDPKMLSTAYGKLASLLLSENYTGFSDLASLLAQVQGPGDIAYVLSRFHEIVNQEGILLNYTKHSLELAKSYLLQGDVDSAIKALTNATYLLARVNISLVGLEDAAEAVRKRVGASPTPILEAVKALASTYSSKAAEVNQLVNANLTATVLTLEASSDSAWVGAPLYLRGKLTTLSGSPLANRLITVLCDGNPCGEAQTLEDGEYNLAVPIPYKYVEKITIATVYEPTGADALYYRPSVSEPLNIKVLFLTPQVNVTITPTTATPTSTVSVTVTTELTNTNITLWALGQRYESVATQGMVSWSVQVPADASEGTHLVKACTAPRQIYGPGCGSAELVVRRIQLNVSLDSPGYAVALLPFKVKVSVFGENGSIPLTFDVVLAINGTNLSTHKLASSVPVEVELPMPWYLPTGPAKLVATVFPSDPMFSSTSAEADVFVINPILLAMAALLLTGAATVYIRLSKRPEKTETPARLESEEERAEVAAELKESEKVEATVGPTKQIYEESPTPLSVDNPVIAEYLKAVRIVEEATGIKMKPSHTLSEYLSLVEARLGDRSVYFEQLTRMVEAHLYADMEVEISLLASLRKHLETGEGEK
ncbi:MAG: DUF4129 domain-containing protein [Infirmifilum sp.]